MNPPAKRPRYQTEEVKESEEGDDEETPFDATKGISTEPHNPQAWKTLI